MQDITTLGVVYVRYCGYVVVVKVEGGVNENVNSLSHQNIELFDQPEGGGNALNINRFLNPSALSTFTSLRLYIIFNININLVCALSRSLFLFICNFTSLSYNMNENNVFE